ncbi:metal ABC transporter permease [Corynebacterium liangguodongii]|uniref:Metal ABC transporter permease n=1 Tax=Corynebacterium liangguodongii TaxID=2079535 RepID=A0A2S0WC38_9CORY|nr:metal ABC transporter permease [Corynebacterium liangguodongii]AWB83314.1 metal ABC transporter permease [Corynebacterium liangguodongii]PWC00596.1 metal ABC transporter permease [Corynebacterium liangguodongii]
MTPADILGDYTYAHTLTGTVTIGACAGALGPLVYLRRRALLADAISHASLPGLVAAFTAAALLGLNGRSIPLLLCGAMAAGFLAVRAIDLLPRIAPIPADAAIAAVLTTFFSAGQLGMQYVSRTPLPGKAGIEGFLLGNAASLTRADIVSTLLVCAAVLVALAAVHHRQVSSVFDAQFAQVLGLRPTIYGSLALFALTVVTVVGIKVVGVVLMIAVVISPAAAARQWVTRVPAFIAAAAAIGALSSAAGSYLSIAHSIPTGPAIVMVQFGIVAVCFACSPRRKAVAA